MGYSTLNFVILGPQGAGKSTFINICRRLNQLEQPAQEDFARIEVDNELQLYLFGAPANDPLFEKSSTRQLTRYDIWEVLAEGMIGFVAIVDCTGPNTFSQAKAMISFFRRSNPTPYIVVANRYDQVGATDLRDLRHALELEDGNSILPCNVTDQFQVKAVLLTLINRINERYFSD